MTNEEKIKEMKVQMGIIKRKVKSEMHWLRITCDHNYNIDIAEDTLINIINALEKYWEGVLNE